MLKKLVGLVLFTIVLSGCSNILGKEEFIDIIQQIENEVEQKEWDELTNNGEKLLATYNTNKWKLQMIGDEREYEELFETIHRLLVAIEEKDTTQIKLQLATIKAIIEDIYSI